MFFFFGAAGVSLGPFPDYRSSMGMLMPSANELWEFAKPESEISQRLEAAVKVVLAYGARITYVGSMDDQLVPMEVGFFISFLGLFTKKSLCSSHPSTNMMLSPFTVSCLLARSPSLHLSCCVYRQSNTHARLVS